MVKPLVPPPLQAAPQPRTPEDYLKQLQQLLPQGTAWPRDVRPPEPEPTLTSFLRAPADELARVEARAWDLLGEADPRTTSELLPDWERVAGLPDACSQGAETEDERRAALVLRLTDKLGQSPAFFVALAECLGLEVMVIEFRPFIAGISRVGDQLNGPHEVRFQWRLLVKGNRAVRFKTGRNRAGDRLLDFIRATELECFLRRLAPAHSILIIGYEGDC